MTAWLYESLVRVADAEEAKVSGGMIALMPSVADVPNLVVPGGEPPEDLHVTLVYLGKDLAALPPPTELQHRCEALSNSYGPIEAQVLGPAHFNPTGPEPCAVYLICGNPQLFGVYTDAQEFAAALVPTLPEQHVPWIPHLTAGYNMDPAQLTYTGSVLFDRVSLHWMGQQWEFPL